MSAVEISVELRLLSVDRTTSAEATANVRMRYGPNVYDTVDLTPLAAEQLAGALVDAATRARTARQAITRARSAERKAPTS